MSYAVAPEELTRAMEWKKIPSTHEADPPAIDLHDHLGYGRDHPWRSARGDDIDDIDNPCTLGLHRDRSGIQPSYFIGAVRLGKGGDAPTLVVQPKIPNMDFAGIFAEVLAAPPRHTGVQRLGELFDMDSGSEAIEGQPLPQLTLIEITAFLATLAAFCQRHLRQGFVRVRANLTGRVRGRILESAQVRQNLVRARADRMACEYTRLSLDTLENRILKAALQVASRWLDLQGVPTAPVLRTWVRIARAALASVPEHRVTERDWSRARKTGLMAAYARPLDYARLILRRIHIKADGGIEEKEKKQTPPFYLDANRLFEAWAGVCLASAGLDPVAQGERRIRISNCLGEFTFRPDFVLQQTEVPAVVDAKYKVDSIVVADIYQAIGYARLLSETGPASDSKAQDREAWLAVPPNKCLASDVSAAKEEFRTCWNARRGTSWPDGFRLGCVRVPLPRWSQPV